MLKSRTLAYDGRGNFALHQLSQIDEALHALKDRPLYAEKWVPFVKEIAVMVVRSTNGEVVSYPAVETVHKNNICHLVFAPLRGCDPAAAESARQVAEDAVKTFEGAGIFGVEMFLLADGMLLLSHTLPRVMAHFTTRLNIPQRDRSSTSQLRPLHNRSLRNFSIREPPPRNPFTSSRVHSAQSAISRHAQHHRSILRH